MDGRQIRCRPHDWYVEQGGAGPDLLLLHGTGASTHSWHGLCPLLAQRFRVISVDLPGHGRSRLGNRMRCGLETMTEDIASLCRQEDWQPKAIVGHSAGAAIALRLASRIGEARVIGLNPALQPFHGLAGVTFPVAARMMAMTPGLVPMLSRSLGQSHRIGSLLQSTGSDIPAASAARYKALFQDKAHIEGALLMMAQWKLDGLLADLPLVQTQCLFLTGSQDSMVPPVTAVEAADQMPHAETRCFDGYGHLLHEEAPDLVARQILNWLNE